MNTRLLTGTLLISTAVLWMGCTTELPDGSPTDGYMGRSVKVIVNMADARHETRAVDITSSANFTEFSMYGFNDKETKTVVRDNNVHWTKTDNVWIPSTSVTWPDEGTMDYYAVAPTLDKPTVSKKTMTAKKHTLTYVVPTDVDDQVDLLTAVSLKQTAGTNDGAITLTFAHAMCLQTFSIKNKVPENYRVTIHGIKLYNVLSTGTLTMDGANASWAVTPDVYTDYEYIFDEDKVLATNDGTNDYEDISTVDDKFFVTHEQKTTAYVGSKKTPKVVKPDAYDAHKSFIGILCKVQDMTQGINGQYVVGSADEWKEVYFGFGGKKWEMGFIYQNKINFNGGYDDEGLYVWDHLPDVTPMTLNETDFNVITTVAWDPDFEHSKELSF